MSAPRVLIVEGDLAEAQLLEDAIFEIPERETPSKEGVSRRYWWNARVMHADTLAGGLAIVRAGQADLILLNPSLPDRQGIDSFRMLKVHAPEVPVVILLDRASGEHLGRLALREGAQDYVFKSRCDWEVLSHAMENAIERSRTMKAFWKSFFRDELTGLPNRSGFLYLAGVLHTAHLRNGGAGDGAVSRIIVATLHGASDREMCAAAESIHSCLGANGVAGRLGQHQVGVLTNEITAAELASRIARTQHGLKFTWTEQPVTGAESMDRYLVFAENGSTGLGEQTAYAASVN